MAKKRKSSHRVKRNMSYSQMAKLSRRGVRNNHKAVHRVLSRQGS